MEQRLASSRRVTVNEKKFIETALLSDLRIDGRGPFDYRNLTIQFGCEDGSSEVHLGQTRVLGFVTSQLVQPYRDRPNEGTLAIYIEFSPMADPSFEAGRPGEFAVELGRIIDRGLRESRALDTETLCVVAGKWVWSIRVDLHIVDNGGNLVDAANIAALAALLTSRRPESSLGGEDGQEVIIHSPEVKEPVPLIVHHLPIAITFAFIGEETRAVIDPSYLEEDVMRGKLTATLNTNGDICAIQKAGGTGVIQSVIMQCLRIASVKVADITDKIKKAVESHDVKRGLKKIKRQLDATIAGEAAEQGVCISEDIVKPKTEAHDTRIRNECSDDMELEFEVKDRKSLENNKAGVFTGGPSSWDPCSKSASPEYLKASLAPKVASVDEKIEAEESWDQGRSVVEIINPSSSAETGERCGKTKKTLLDAVKKPKHKRKSNKSKS
ncbi:hypothetical protein M569_00914 [Genlisea aurea]|uniref:Protein ECERIFERUM 7 n=1 Tax=Genlisea aurea TaxID=192259 RepID=S8D8Z9_9LAMI|nr:hypothetical protein M569_00914 [Genlisea aurea]